MPSSLILALLAASPAPLILHVEGEGWLRFEREGRAVYAREASLTVSQGRLVNQEGLSLLPSLSAAAIEGAKADLEGRITIQGREIGRLVLAKFPSDQSLTQVKGMWVAADRPTLGSPGEGTFGVVRMGARGTEAVKPQQPSQAKPQPQPQKQPDQPAQKPPAQSPVEPNPRPIPPVKAPEIGPLVIKARAISQATSETIYLKDVAEISGIGTAKAGEIQLGITPPYGVERPISKSLVEAKLGAAGFARGSWSLNWPGDKVGVRRQGQDVPHEAFVKAGREALSKILPFGTQIEPEGIAAAMACPLGDYVMTALEPRIERDRVRLQVDISFQGVRFNGRPLTFKITSPFTAMRVGQEIQVRVRSGGASVIAKGKVRQIDQVRGLVTVDMDKGVTLTARPGTDGIFEVVL